MLKAISAVVIPGGVHWLVYPVLSCRQSLRGPPLECDLDSGATPSEYTEGKFMALCWRTVQTPPHLSLLTKVASPVMSGVVPPQHVGKGTSVVLFPKSLAQW